MRFSKQPVKCQLKVRGAGTLVQVLQMSWDGTLLNVCSLGGGPPAVLGGALAERLLVVRGGRSAAPGGQAEVSQRHLPLLGPLLTGWAGLAASNILPGAAASTC